MISYNEDVEGFLSFVGEEGKVRGRSVNFKRSKASLLVIGVHSKSFEKN